MNARPRAHPAPRAAQARAARGRQHRTGPAPARRRRPRPVADRAPRQSFLSPDLGHPAPRHASQGQISAQAAGPAARDRPRRRARRQGAAHRLFPLSRPQAGRTRPRLPEDRPARGLSRLSPQFPLARRPRRRDDARQCRACRRDADARLALRPWREAERARLARGQCRLAHPLLDDLFAADPVEQRPGLSQPRPHLHRAHRPPSRSQRRQGADRPFPRHCLGRDHRGRAAAAGRRPTPGVRRGRPQARAGDRLPRPTAASSPARRKSSSTPSSCSPCSPPSMARGGARCRPGLPN